MIPLVHNAVHFFPSLNYASVPADRPEQIYTAFAMLCLFGSVVWHTMSGCAHQVGMELCARYVSVLLEDGRHAQCMNLLGLIMLALDGQFILLDEVRRVLTLIAQAHKR